MAILTKSELKRVESKYSEGIHSAHVVRIFASRGMRFSEATLRKYVQLGLLPTSRRVGMGRHRGSSGLYPVAVVGLINRIKQGLEAGQSLTELGSGTLRLRSDVGLLEAQINHVFDSLGVAVKARHKGERAKLTQALQAQRKAFSKAFDQLEALLGQVDKAPLARAASRP